MNNDPLHPADRLLELLADQATVGLSLAEQEELDRLLAQHPEVNPLDFDRTAALVWHTAQEPDRELPEALRQRILDDAKLPTKATPATSLGINPLTIWQVSSWAGWFVAASMLVGLGIWSYVSQKPNLSLGERITRFAAEAPDLIQVPGASPDPKKTPQVAGQVLWSGKLQEGYLNLKGLPANDPNKSRYQLWIFDGTRDERYPVDGGVFDIAGDQAVVVPIHAKLPVREPKLFAITVEPPDGVVVSNRKNIVMVASVR